RPARSADQARPCLDGENGRASAGSVPGAVADSAPASVAAASVLANVRSTGTQPKSPRAHCSVIGRTPAKACVRSLTAGRSRIQLAPTAPPSVAMIHPKPRSKSMKKLVLETTAPFQGLPELVAYDEGLFEKEGLLIEWADREKGVEKKVETDVTSPKGVNPFASHGKLFEQGKADMYNACEWGNYCRVQETSAGSRQVGRRAIITYSALVVAPDSPIYTPQQLANRTIGVPFYFGTHYIALHMLEGFLRREEIKLCRAPNGSRYRLAALMKGEVDATTLTEPHITLAEKKCCRTI